MINVDAVILASGLSRRMGSVNKLLLEYQGQTLIERTVTTVIKANCFKNILVIVKDKEVEELLSKYNNVTTVFNPRYVYGKSEAIKLAIRILGESEGTMFIVGDQPFLDADSILRLWGEFIQDISKVIVPCIGRTVGNPVIFPKRLYTELGALEGEQGGMKILNGKLESVKKVTLNNHRVFFDIDTKNDYQLLLNDRV
ncbi:MAG: nucleotidyltransferase family protein [Sarcina sp.]